MYIELPIERADHEVLSKPVLAPEGPLCRIEGHGSEHHPSAALGHLYQGRGGNARVPDEQSHDQHSPPHPRERRGTWRDGRLRQGPHQYREDARRRGGHLRWRRADALHHLRSFVVQAQHAQPRRLVCLPRHRARTVDRASQHAPCRDGGEGLQGDVERDDPADSPGRAAHRRRQHHSPRRHGLLPSGSLRLLRRGTGRRGVQGHRLRWRVP